MPSLFWYRTIFALNAIAESLKACIDVSDEKMFQFASEYRFWILFEALWIQLLNA